jgi:Zn-dependent M28 family amino/carboxypeptidase
MDWLGPDDKPHSGTSLRGQAQLSDEAAAELFTAIGRELARVQAGAGQRAGSGFALPALARIASRSRHQRITSPNVAAILPGSDPTLAGEVVVFSAHLDHLSPGKEVDGDGIYNGFYDNAMGISLMLESARALATAATPPRRSVVFLAVTGEERGLLGSAHFARHPPAELGPIVANVNLDMPLFLHPVSDVVAFGSEHSNLQPLVERAARAAGFALSPDPMPEEVIFVRSDQYSFVEVGIPAVYLIPGFGSRDPQVPGDRAVAMFRDEHYHMPSDEPGLPVDWHSVVRFLDANAQLGREIADSPTRPAWNPKDFFGETFAAGRR